MDQATQVQSAIVEMIENAGFPREAVFAIRLALDEAMVNAVKHGNEEADDKSVHIEFSIDDDKATLMVRDEGPGFDPDALPDPTAIENISRPSGRGVMLMRAYMTEVSFNDSGNQVTLVKQRGCKKPHGD
ncbi:MAG: ATP-binding protein [Planctomycetota bacterium]